MGQRVLALLVLGLAAGVAVAQVSQRAAPQRVDERRSGGMDQQFAEKAATSGMKEVELGKMGLDMANTDAVRRFAQHMVDDHARANRELIAILDQKGIHVPKMPPDADREKADRLSKVRGNDFDREYMNEMLKDHQKAVSLFEQEARDGQDPDLKGFAAKTLPTLREHLKLAEGIIDSNSSGGGGR
jgi:putative membrane protein